MEDIKKTIGIRIRTARKTRHLSIEELAARIGRTYGSVSKIERGLTSPTIETLILVSDALDLRLSELLAGFGYEHNGDRSNKEAELLLLARTLSDREFTAALTTIQAFTSITTN